MYDDDDDDNEMWLRVTTGYSHSERKAWGMGFASCCVLHAALRVLCEDLKKLVKSYLPSSLHSHFTLLMRVLYRHVKLACCK
jgi:hypothetical protein